jgi:hypothetical protein
MRLSIVIVVVEEEEMRLSIVLEVVVVKEMRLTIGPCGLAPLLPFFCHFIHIHTYIHIYLSSIYLSIYILYIDFRRRRE